MREFAMNSMPYSRLLVHLTAEQLAAFGAFVCVHSRLEVIAGQLVHSLCDFKDDFVKPALVITTGMSLRRKLELAVKLAHIAAPEGSDFPVKVSEFAKEVKGISDKRNDFAHAIWGQYGTPETWPDSVAVAEITKRSPKGTRRVRHELKTEDFEAAANETFKLIKSCLSFAREAQRIHAERRGIPSS